MARGSKQSNKTYFKIAYDKNDKDNGQPFFTEQKKEGDNWIGISQDTFLEGKLIGVSESSYEYKNKPQHTFELIINGGEENYALQLNFGYFTRNILNSIASIKDLENTQIRLEIWRNKDGYVTVAVKNTTSNPEGERTEWELDWKKLPKLDEDKWLGSFTYFINMIKGNLPAIVEEAQPSEKPAGVQMDANPLEMETEFAQKKADTTTPIDNSNPIDDLPF